MASEYKYEQIAEVLREQILADVEDRNGLLRPGSKLPTESELEDQFGVSRAVTRQALDLLEGEGLVTRVRGHGTFVREEQPMIRRAARHYSSVPGAPFAEEALESGRTPRYSHTTSKDRAGPGVAVRLKVEIGDPVTCTEYISYADDHPVMLVTSHEPLAITGGTPIEDPEFGPLMGGGLVARFASIGMKPTRIVHRERTRPPRPSEADALKLRPGVSVFVITRVAYFGETPVETAVLVLAGDQFEAEWEVIP